MKQFDLLAVNYAYQNTFRWGGLDWKLKHSDLEAIRDLIDPDSAEKTGMRVWAWHHERTNKKMITTKTNTEIGEQFLEYLYGF